MLIVGVSWVSFGNLAERLQQREDQPGSQGRAGVRLVFLGSAVIAIAWIVSVLARSLRSSWWLVPAAVLAVASLIVTVVALVGAT